MRVLVIVGVIGMLGIMDIAHMVHNSKQKQKNMYVVVEFLN